MGKESNGGYKMTKPLKTIEQYRKRYFPEEWKKQKLKEMTPEELGKELAKITIEKVRVG